MGWSVLLFLFSLGIVWSSSIDSLVLSNVKQITFGGINSGPKISEDGRTVFEGTGEEYGTSCTQIYSTLNGSEIHRVSTGIGENRNGHYISHKNMFVYSSTIMNHLPLVKNVTDTCKRHLCDRRKNDRQSQEICKEKDNLAELTSSDVFFTNSMGNVKRSKYQIRTVNHQVAVDNKGVNVVYSSVDGNPNLFLISRKTNKTVQLTDSLGLGMNPQFSPDGQRILFLQSRVPKEDYDSYKQHLKFGFVNIFKRDLFVVNVDGSGLRKLAVFEDNGCTVTQAAFIANNQILLQKKFGGYFTWYTVDIDGNNLQVTTVFQGRGTVTDVSANSRGTLVWIENNQIFSGQLNVESYHDNDIFFFERDYNVEPISGEKHLNNIRQLTFGGQNAEGYFDFKGEYITLQATGQQRYGTECDQIYKLNINQKVTPDTPLQRISTGLGTCTCSYFFPDDSTMIYASTFASINPKDLSKTCPPKKCQSPEAKSDSILAKLCNTSYTWDIFPDYDIYKVNKYGNIIQRLTDTYGYDAEGAISPDGKTIVFTSLRSGDLELWLMDSDGGNLRQLTNVLGYDGGPFFSPDGSKVIFRSSRPKTQEQIEKYKKLLSYNLVEPLEMELHSINVDGTDLKKITNLGGSNWAPFYLKDNKRIVFSTNFNQTGHFGAFDLYLVKEDGQGTERITFNQGGFDAFPMQSRDGRSLVWGSSRGGGPYDLNLFLADWTD